MTDVPAARVPLGVWEAANDRAEDWQATALRLALGIVAECPDPRSCVDAKHREAHEVIAMVYET